ncbi:hypothetical protein SmJEL517_g03824 [Synchytrium microbalum]|uniref:Protein kinase domain-containing protein n=1 Tax=Synchytrium microbalum TaxID=1806994 RepID=A0A507C5G1_9FUNG|nr:uncharacterized protein SmJEL517_g03824 [Synchytrium microbalum]TPX33216.1 hypothetical protein SmJEL517_g03824 [Synchytrium microbalum]
MKSLFFFGKKKEDRPRLSSKLALAKVVHGGSFQSGFEEHYFLGKKLGSGSFAVVKECTRKTDSKKFAVKIIDKVPLKGKDEMLRTEIQVLEMIDHPNIIGLRDKYETPSHMYLVTDLATGGELFEQIVKKGSYTEGDAAKIVRELFDATAYLHELDIVHRDLKPENLLFRDTSDSADIMITDFGLSRVVDSDVYLKTACGTPDYVAPEVLKQMGHGKPVDVWALGVITYVLLCGFTPFWGEDQPALFEAIVKCRYEYEEEYWGNVSDNAKDFINKCLTVDPSKRPTAQEAIDHPWLASESKTDLLPTVRKGFNARRQWGKAISAVRGVSRLGTLVDMSMRSKSTDDSLTTDSASSTSTQQEDKDKKLIDVLAKLKSNIGHLESVVANINLNYATPLVGRTALTVQGFSGSIPSRFVLTMVVVAGDAYRKVICAADAVRVWNVT